MRERIIVDRQVVPDVWNKIDDEQPVPQGDVYVTLSRWIAGKDELADHDGRVGVVVPGDVDLEAQLVAHLPGLDAVAVVIPKFTDGRACSLARLLRERYGFGGELRAVGNVLRDQLFHLHRVGFTAFEMAPGKDVDDALRAFREFSEVYQPAADQPEPLWKRRRGGSA